MFSQSRLTAQGNQCNQSTCMLGLKLDKEMGKRIAKLTANTDKPRWTFTLSVQLWRSNGHSRLINKTPDAFIRGIKVALPSHIRQTSISNSTDHLIKIHCQSLHPATGILKLTVTVLLLLVTQLIHSHNNIFHHVFHVCFQGHFPFDCLEKSFKTGILQSEGRWW